MHCPPIEFHNTCCKKVNIWLLNRLIVIIINNKLVRLFLFACTACEIHCQILLLEFFQNIFYFILLILILFIGYHCLTVLLSLLIIARDVFFFFDIFLPCKSTLVSFELESTVMEYIIFKTLIQVVCNLLQLSELVFHEIVFLQWSMTTLTTSEIKVSCVLILIAES